MIASYKKGENMYKYTKFILTVIAIGLIGNLFQGEIITSAEAKISSGKANTILRLVKENNQILKYLYDK